MVDWAQSTNLLTTWLAVAAWLMPDQTDSGVCSHGIVALASISNLADGQDSTDPGVCSHGIVALASISNLADGQDSVY